MKIDLLCFAYIREITGKERICLEIPDHLTTSSFLDYLCELYPEISPYRSVLKVSMNEEFLSGDDFILENSTVAVFPPVSGG